MLNISFLRYCFFSRSRKLVCEMQWISLYKRITLPLQMERKGVNVKFPRNSTTDYSNFSQSSENWRTVRKQAHGRIRWIGARLPLSRHAFGSCRDRWAVGHVRSRSVRRTRGTPSLSSMSQIDQDLSFGRWKTSFETPLKEIACQRTDRHWYTGSASIHYAPATRSSRTTAIGRMLVHWWRCVKLPVHACVAL